MGRKSSNSILSTVPRKGFIGRAAELDSLSNHHSNGSGALIVAAKPSCGSSELLKQTYDKLFFDQNETVPFYFEFRPGDRSAKRAAVRFLQSFLTQFTAFRRNDPFLTAATPDICEISELSAPSDADWIRQLVDTCKRDTELNDESSFILHAFSAPLRATLAGIPVFPMIDGLEFTLTLDDSRLLFEQVKEAFNSFSGGYVLCGKRRFLGPGLKRWSNQNQQPGRN